MRAAGRFGLIAPMDRLSPNPSLEPSIPEAPGSGALRRTAYAGMALLLLAGGWIRFNDKIASVSPALAGPAGAIAQQAADAGGPQGLFELQMMPSAAVAAAVAAMGLPASNAALLAADLKRDRIRLVQMPLFDAGVATGADTLAGRAVEVSSGGYTRLVQLTRQPVVVTLPISRVGTVSFRVVGHATDALGIGALTLSGPVVLPELSAGQQLDVGVVAQ